MTDNDSAVECCICKQWYEVSYCEITFLGDDGFMHFCCPSCYQRAGEEGC